MGCTPVEEILVDPETPVWFWSSPGKNRSGDNQVWLGRAFILTTANPHFPTGVRYDVYCLEDVSATHPVVWGMFGTIEEALQRAKEGPPWRASASR